MKERQQSTTLLSGQAELLRSHDRWIMAYGITTALDVAAPKIFHHKLVGNQVEHIMLPTQVTVKDTRRGEVEMRQVIFPGYFFIGVNNENPTWWELEDDVPEILGFLKKCTEYKEPEKISFLSSEDRAHIASLIKDIPRHTIITKFAVEDRVIVTSGSFDGLYGNIASVEASRRRAKVNIEVENSVFPTWLPLFDLEVLEQRKGKIPTRQEDSSD